MWTHNLSATKYCTTSHYNVRTTLPCMVHRMGVSLNHYTLKSTLSGCRFCGPYFDKSRITWPSYMMALYVYCTFAMFIKLHCCKHAEMDPYLHNVASSAGHIYVRENMCTERYYDMRHSCCEQSYCMLWCCILM